MRPLSGEFADAYRDIDPLLDEIDEAVVEAQVDLCGRMRGQEGLHQRHELETAESHRCGNTQPARQ
jgi:hypothetical protein